MAGIELQFTIDAMTGGKRMRAYILLFDLQNSLYIHLNKNKRNMIRPTIPVLTITEMNVLGADKTLIPFIPHFPKLRSATTNPPPKRGWDKKD